MRLQFTFYESFAKALRRIKRDSDRAKAYDAICNYALYGEEPDVDALPDVAAVAFDLIRPTLDASAKKAKAGQAGGSKPQANDKQTASEKEKEKEKEKEIENECYKEKAKRKLFAAPTVEDVRAYCQSSGHHIDADAFVDYFVSCGWKVGNKPMKDWQAAVRNWERRDRDTPTVPQKKKVGYQPNWNDPKRDDWLKQINARIQSDEKRVSASQYAREHGISYEQAVKELADG